MASESKNRRKLAQRLKEEAERKRAALMKTQSIRWKFIILSGKGGVGKSVVTANLAMALASLGYEGRVGILDTDVHGPSIPRYLGVEDRVLRVGDNGIEPVVGPLGIKIVSASSMLSQKETPVIWRGPLKTKFVRDMLVEINWGQIDALFLDTPPGTGDELQAIVNYVSKITGGIAVTIPSDVSLHVVKRSIGFLKKMNIPALGVIENMSYVLCPDGSVHKVFGEGGERISRYLGLPLLAKIPASSILAEPIEPDNNPYIMEPDKEPMRTFRAIAQRIIGG